MGSRSCLAIPSCLAVRPLAVFLGAPTRPLQNCSNFIGRSQNTMFPRLWTERSEGHDRPPGNLRISHQGHNEAQSTKKSPKGLQNEAQTVWGPRVGIILSYRFCCCEWVTLRKNGHPHKNQTTSVRTNCTCASRGMPLTRREVPSSLKKHSTSASRVYNKNQTLKITAAELDSTEGERASSWAKQQPATPAVCCTKCLACAVLVRCADMQASARARTRRSNNQQS